MGTSALTRRERIERIATAERDRRAGRVGLAIASLGEATEWPARVVMALARMPESEAAETRRILEEGLDLWAREAGLDSLDPATEAAAAQEEAAKEASTLSSRPDGDPEPDSEFEFDAGMATSTEAALERPIDQGELERAFAEAEAQTHEMHGANDVAERVLMDEPIDLPELDGEGTIGSLGRSTFDATETTETIDAAGVDESFGANPAVSSEESAHDSALVLATLERWLQNLAGRQAGRAQ